MSARDAIGANERELCVLWIGVFSLSSVELLVVGFPRLAILAGNRPCRSFQIRWDQRGRSQVRFSVFDGILGQLLPKEE